MSDRKFASGYRGRFAPSPTGPLHAGSLLAALASWLDARANEGQWLVRIEDADTSRCVTGCDQVILNQLRSCGLIPDEVPVWQSQRSSLYQKALEGLILKGKAYPCSCSRAEIALLLAEQGLRRLRNEELVYPGTCRNRMRPGPVRSWRLRADSSRSDPEDYIQQIHWSDRRLGEQYQDVGREVGDFIIKRGDGTYAYQLAVVVDDADQCITHVVRGEDLSDNTARQIVLQRLLGLSTPKYLHTALVLGLNGEKLSKQNGAQPIDTSTPMAALHSLCQAARGLGLQVGEDHLPNALSRGASAMDSPDILNAIRSALEDWTHQWRNRWQTRCDM